MRSTAVTACSPTPSCSGRTAIPTAACRSRTTTPSSMPIATRASAGSRWSRGWSYPRLNRYGLAQDHFGRNRFPHGRPRLHAFEIADQRRMALDLDAGVSEQEQRPGQVSIRDGETIADEMLAALQMIGCVRDALLDPSARSLGRIVLVPEGRKQESLVDLRADEAQPFLEAVAIGVAGRRGEPRLRFQVRDVLQHRGTLCQPLAILQHQHRHCAFRRDGAKIRIVLDALLGLEMHEVIAHI